MKSYHKINRLLILIALLLCIVQSNKSYAQTRYNGAELYADYIGSGSGNYKYRVTLIIYETCPLTGTAAPAFNSTETVNYQSSTLAFCQSKTLKLIASSPDTLKQIYCPATTNSCSSPTSTNLGFGRAIYSDTVTVGNGVAMSSNDQEFEWHGSPRDNGVNLFSSAYRITVRCAVNNTGSFYSTSTPRYTLIPKFNVCYNQHNALALGPFDPDGDSLYTYGIQSLSNNGCFSSPNITYAVGYGPGIPIDASASDPFTINPYTGVTTFTPTVNGNKYSLAWRTDKYDPNSGTLLGFCMRDNEIYVQSCTTPPPGVDSIPYNISGNTGNYDSVNHIISVCPGATLSFGLNGYGPANSHVTMRSDNGNTAKGSNFYAVYKSLTTYDTLLGSFTWTPSSTDIGLHIVNFTIKDSTCTTDAEPRTDFQVIIRVLNSVVAGPDQAYCPGPNSLPVQLNATGTPPGTTFYWYNEATGFADNTISDSTAQNPTVTPLVTTNYVVVATTISGIPLVCKNMDTVKVNVFPREKVNGGPDQTICLNQTAQLNPVALKPDSVAWAFDPTLNNDSLRQPLAKPVIANGTTTYFVYIIDANKCHYRDSTHVITKGIAPKLFTLATPDTVCPGGTSIISTTVQEQSCGAGKAACKGTPNDLVLDGPSKKPVCGSIGSSYTFGDPTPYTYYYYSNGQRMQIIYTKQELEAAGFAAGYINNIAFTVCSKAQPSSDSLSNFKIGITCTTDDHFSGSTFTSYPFTTVFSAKNVGTKIGLNTYQFSTPYYWDGSSNLVVQICYSVLNEDSRLSSVTNATGDVVKVVNTAGTQCIQTWSNSYNFTGAIMDGCAYNNAYQIFTSSSRPATTFNVCQSAASYTYKWSPGTYLNNTTNAVEVASNVFSNTKYTVNVYANGDPSCTSVDSVRLSVDTSTEIAADPRSIILCRPGYTDLSAQARGSRPISNMACGTSNPQNCSSPSVVVAANSLSPGNQNATPFRNTSNLSQWIINRSILTSAGMTSGTIRSMDLTTSGANGGGNVFANVEVRISCTPKDAFTSPADTISARNMVLEYTNTSLTVPTNGVLNIPFNTPYSWDTTQNIVIQVCYGSLGSAYPYVYATATNTSYNSMVQYYGYANYFCKGTAGVQYTPVVYKAMPAVTFHYCPAPEGTFAYTWSSGLFLSDSTIQSPTAYVPKSITYKVSTQGRNHCVVSDSVNIYLPVHHFSVYPVDTAICAGKTATFHAKGGYSYQWFQNGFKKATTLSCTNCANPVSSPTDTTTYQIVVSDSVSCSDTLYAKIEVKPIPNVKIINNDTTIDYGSSVQLYASGANVFTWSPTASLSNPNIVNPIASPTEPVTYTVIGLAADGCSAMDTVHVNINYRGHLFVPSAFTPNGDGKNDKFRVSNLTFEKILEFRVYNRWGQQVYEGTDNTGWDGKWKNVDQDLGSYQYLIRVGFPDGFVETFKGGVTLVR